MNTKYAVCSDIGRVRNVNQDNFYLNGSTLDERIPIQILSDQCDHRLQIFAVCDGMGGEQYGEKAALFAVDTLRKYHTDAFGENWRSYIEEANKIICEFSKENKCYTGTTASCIYLDGKTLQGFNIGDTRIYQIRGDKMIQLSVDHTEFQLMVDAGFLKKEDFSRSKAHNYLTQHLGIEPDRMLIEPTVTQPIEVEKGDRYLICTDGLYGVVSDEEILQIIKEEMDVEQCCDRLVDYARERKSRDNITALIVEIIGMKPIKETDAVEKQSEEETTWTKQKVQLKDVGDISNTYDVSKNTDCTVVKPVESVFSQAGNVSVIKTTSPKWCWFRRILMSLGGLGILAGIILSLK